jgi:hypothetical protein
MANDKGSSRISFIRKYGEKVSELVAEWWDLEMSNYFSEQKQ